MKALLRPSVWCRQGDWFAQYAAQGRRNASSRVTTFPLFPHPTQASIGIPFPSPVSTPPLLTPFLNPLSQTPFFCFPLFPFAGQVSSDCPCSAKLTAAGAPSCREQTHCRRSVSVLFGFSLVLYKVTNSLPPHDAQM